MVDPNLAAEQAQAQATQLTQMQTEAQSDTAAMMARYGTRLAVANVVGPTAPGAASPTPTGAAR